MKIMKQKKIISLFGILIIPTILSILWFREGNIMGVGESGLPFYNFQIAYNSNRDAWAYYALGHPVNIGAAASPTYWFLAQLQNLGIPAFILQALFLWLILIVSGFAIYKLVKEVFPYINDIHAIFAVLFYWFNPFSLVNVWNRFLNNFFVFYALLPLAVYFCIKGLRSKKYIYAFLIGLASALLSYALTSMAFIIMLWGTLIYFGIIYFLTHKENRFFTVKFFFLTFLFWTLANFWWISQVFSYLQLGSFKEVLNTSFKLDTNYNTFSLLSQRLGSLTYIFRLKHVSFFTDSAQLTWVKIYSFPLIVFFEFLITGILLLPLIVKRKANYVIILAGLFFLSAFLAKGNNPPLGEVFDKFFSTFSILQLFRNPLEKFGFILAFSATVLFAAGSFEVERIIGFKGKIITRVFIGLFLIAVWGFPFWLGYIFTSPEAPTNKLETGYQVKAPLVYKEISKELISQKDNFRLIVLPIGGEGITYTWEKGYSGVELSNQLLPKTAVSFNTNIPFYDDISSAVGRLISTREGLAKIMDILNSKYILVRKDIDWKARGMRDPDNISRRIEKVASASSLKKVKDIDNVDFWEDTGWQDRSIYLTNNLVESKPISPMEDILNVEIDKSAVLYNSSVLADKDLTKYEIVHPSFKFSIGEKNAEHSVILRDDIIFPAINILPSSFLYPLIGIKERFETARINDQNFKIIKRISLLGKRLMEAEKELALGNFDGAIKTLDKYNLQLQELSAYPLGDVPNEKNKVVIIQEELFKVFSRHYKKVDQLMTSISTEKKEKIFRTRELLRSFLTSSGIEPIFGYVEKPSYQLTDRIIYQFNIDKEGDYELLFYTPKWNDYFKKSYSEPIFFQIDNKLISRRGESKNGLLSFGYFKFSPGKHEIGWNSGEPINLVDVPAKFSMRVDHGVSEKIFPIKNLDPYSTYVLKIDYFIKKGSGVLVSIEGNNDSAKKGIVQRQFNKNLDPDGYNYDIKSYTAYYTPTRTSDNAKLIFSVFPWNNCQDIYRTNRIERCESEEFRRPYDRSTEVVISNVSLVKVMTEIPFLKLERKEFEGSKLPELSFNKLNNSEYKINIKDAKEKYALILSELFDPGWTLTDRNGANLTKNHFLVNGYANGWIIDKTGDYQLIAKFTPQDILEKSRIVSSAAILVGLGAVVYLIYKKYRR